MVLVSLLIKKKFASYGKKRQQRAMRQQKLSCGFCCRRRDGEMSKSGHIEKIALAIPAGWKVTGTLFVMFPWKKRCKEREKQGI